MSKACPFPGLEHDGAEFQASAAEFDSALRQALTDEEANVSQEEKSLAPSAAEFEANQLKAEEMEIALKKRLTTIAESNDVPLEKGRMLMGYNAEITRIHPDDVLAIEQLEILYNLGNEGTLAMFGFGKESNMLTLTKDWPSQKDHFKKWFAYHPVPNYTKKVSPVKNQRIQELIEKDGFAIVNVHSVYYYTVGFGLQGKNDLFGLVHYPVSMFKIIASMYAKGEIIPNQGFAVPEMKLPGNGLEYARSKLIPLELQTNSLIQQTLAKATEGFSTQGFSLVLGPDKDNRLTGEEGFAFPYDPNELVQRLVGGVKEDLDRALNEAESIRQALGIK